MLRKTLCVLISVLYTGLFSACLHSNESPVEPSSVAFTARNIELNYQTKELVEGEDPDFSQLYANLVYNSNGAENLPYLRLEEFGGPICITFPDGAPDKISVSNDYIGRIRANGVFEKRERSEPVPEEEIVIQENVVSIPIHPYYLFESSSIPESGEVVRGFGVTCIRDDKTTYYAIAFRSDAMMYQSAIKAVSHCDGASIFHSDGVKGYNDFFLREQSLLKLSEFTSTASCSQTLPYGGVVDFTFPEDGLPDTVEVMNDVLPLNGAVYEYQGDTRSLPLSELTMKDGKLSFIVKPEYFAEGEQNCNVTYVLCTWDSLTSVYTVIFRINP